MRRSPAVDQQSLACRPWAVQSGPLTAEVPYSDVAGDCLIVEVSSLVTSAIKPEPLIMLSTSPRLIKGGIVLVDPSTGQPVRIISLQYNPETLTRSLQIQSAESSDNAGGDRSDALRLVGPPIETYNLEAEIDATDQLEKPDEGANRTALEFGIQPQLAALETILYPDSAHLKQLDSQASAGSFEVTPVQAPLTIFVWSKSRIAPVRITDMSIEEQFFDPNLNPIRAKVTLSMRVLNMNDLGFRHRGTGLYLLYQQQKEQLAKRATPGTFSVLGIGGFPT